MNSPFAIGLTSGVIIALFALSWLLMRAFTKGRGFRTAAKFMWAFLLWNGLMWLTIFLLGSELDRRPKQYDAFEGLYTSLIVIFYGWMFYITPITLVLLGIWYAIARRQAPKQKHRSRRHSS